MPPWWHHQHHDAYFENATVTVVTPSASRCSDLLCLLQTPLFANVASG
jgi:hypothetical protein